MASPSDAGSSRGFSERTALVVGDHGLDRLASSTVCVFGLGGVGAACAMDLVRVGVGRIVACDFDEVGESNLNRLAIGYRRFIGQPKALVLKELAAEVNPSCLVEPRALFISGADAATCVPPGCDFYIDCIDSLNSKANLIAALVAAALPFASSMGTGGRLDPSRLRMGNIWEVKGCPLARSVRQRLRRIGLPLTAQVPCVWSDEEPTEPGDFAPPAPGLPGRPRRRQGSAPFVPQAAGHILASFVTRELLSSSST